MLEDKLVEVRDATTTTDDISQGAHHKIDCHTRLITFKYKKVHVPRDSQPSTSSAQIAFGSERAAAVKPGAYRILGEVEIFPMPDTTVPIPAKKAKVSPPQPGTKTAKKVKGSTPQPATKTAGKRKVPPLRINLKRTAKKPQRK